MSSPEPKQPPEKSLLTDLTGVGTDWRSAVLVPVLAVISALIVGAFVIAVTDLDLLRTWTTQGPGPALAATFRTIGNAYGGLFKGAFGSLRGVSETLTASTPLILAGLSVAVGFQAGLFNIGAEGQMVIGGVSALMIAFSFPGLPAVVHVPLALIGGIIGGGVWGAIPGWLRAKTGAHEVITTIMMNWIAIRLLDYLLRVPILQAPGRTDPVSKSVVPSAYLPGIMTWINRNFRAHLGIVVALLVAWLFYWLLYKSTVGYEFRGVGYNPDAARYAGMNVAWAYILVMALAGAAAGLAGTSQILGVLHRATPGFTAGIGFDAIALALLGRSHPGGVVLAGLLFGALRAGGQQMQVSSSVGIDLITVIQALIIVFIAAPALIRAIYRVRAGEGAGQLTRGWGG
jgi:general nucleoside transport system permease protein